MFFLEKTEYETDHDYFTFIKNKIENLEYHFIDDFKKIEFSNTNDKLNLFQLLKNMLNLDYNKRYSALDCLKSNYFDEDN